MLNQEERTIVEELQYKYLLRDETIAALIQYRRSRPSQSEKAQVIPNFLKLWGEIREVRKIEEKRYREAGSVGRKV